VWQAPTSNRAAAEIRRRKKQRESRRRLALHIRRVTAQVGAETVQVVLNDLTRHGLEMYSPQPFRPGQEVSILLDEQSQVRARARVIFTEHYNCASRVISQQPYPYRVGFVFLFSSESEERSLHQAIEQIATAA
jgi:hypothetical protein